MQLYKSISENARGKVLQTLRVQHYSAVYCGKKRNEIISQIGIKH
jgi:hypothetical protein